MDQIPDTTENESPVSPEQPVPPPVYSGHLEPAVTIALAPPPPVPSPSLRLLAGLESGLLGAALMFAWLLIYSHIDRQYWWGILNLWGAASFGNRSISMGFGIASLAGAAHHLFLHGLAGALAGLAIGRLRGFWLPLAASFAAAFLCFLLAFHVYWPLLAPVVLRVSPQPATAIAYLLYAVALSRASARAFRLAHNWQT
jgi:hypothetical protein